jgi:hypothetical protein
MSLDAESVDLLELSLWLERRIAESPASGGFLQGKTRMRDAVASKLGCSELEAEQVTDTLVARGFVRFLSDDDEPARPGSTPGRWQVARRS